MAEFKSEKLVTFESIFGMFLSLAVLLFLAWVGLVAFRRFGFIKTAGHLDQRISLIEVKKVPNTVDFILFKVDDMEYLFVSTKNSASVTQIGEGLKKVRTID